MIIRERYDRIALVHHNLVYGWAGKQGNNGKDCQCSGYVFDTSNVIMGEYWKPYNGSWETFQMRFAENITKNQRYFMEYRSWHENGMLAFSNDLDNFLNRFFDWVNTL